MNKDLLIELALDSGLIEKTDLADPALKEHIEMFLKSLAIFAKGVAEIESD